MDGGQERNNGSIQLVTLRNSQYLLSYPARSCNHGDAYDSLESSMSQVWLDNRNKRHSCSYEAVNPNEGGGLNRC